MKVAILCGGKGLRFGNTEIPKPMQLVGGRPLLWHVMQWYASHEHREFVLCLGWRGDVIREYFNRTGPRPGENPYYSEDWDIQCVDTGLETQTGGRLLRVRELLGKEFMVAYGDCVGDVDIKSLINFHREHGEPCTLTAYQPRLPFGVISQNYRGRVLTYEERPRSDRWCNAGFMAMDDRVFEHIAGDETPLEQALATMASADELYGREHYGFWRGCDTEKDRQELDDLWNKDEAPWKVVPRGTAFLPSDNVSDMFEETR